MSVIGPVSFKAVTHSLPMVESCASLACTFSQAKHISAIIEAARSIHQEYILSLDSLLCAEGAKKQVDEAGAVQWVMPQGNEAALTEKVAALENTTREIPLEKIPASILDNNGISVKPAQVGIISLWVE